MTHTQQRPFHLTRYYSLAALLSILVAATTLGGLYRHFAEQQLIKHAEQHNVELTRYMSYMLWSAYGKKLANLPALDDPDIQNTPSFHKLHQMVLRQLRDSNIVKFKFFSTQGLTLYSSSVSEIGADKSKHAGFIAAMNGQTSSHLSFRDKFYADANQAELYGRQLLSSYVPILDDNGEIEAVAEVYNDVTSLLDEIDVTNTQLVLITMTVMLVLYSVLYAIVLRADRIIQEKSEIQRRNEAQIQYQANHDPLIGLPNRRYFEEMMQQRIETAKKEGQSLAILFIDLDRFKPINDKLGHRVGDALLQIISKRLSDNIRGSDLVSRFGGDEFTMLVDHVDNASCAEQAAERILAIISEPVYLSEKHLSVGASIGIALFPQHATDISELIKHADTAMYYAKEHGRNCIALYTPEMNDMPPPESISEPSNEPSYDGK